MRWIIALFAGGLFGAGLAVSGMADPTRVRAFLDLTGGAWDPTLAFVMGGAIIPMAVAWVVRGRLDAPVAAPEFTVPGTNPIKIGSASCGKECVSTCRSRWSPYH